MRRNRGSLSEWCCSAARVMAFGPGRLRDQSRATLSGEIGPEPLGLDPQPVLQLRKRHEMQENPGEPDDEPAHAKSPGLQDREILADYRHVALVGVSEWMFWLPSLELSRDQASDIASLLDRCLHHAGHRPPIAPDR